MHQRKDDVSLPSSLQPVQLGGDKDRTFAICLPDRRARWPDEIFLPRSPLSALLAHPSALWGHDLGGGQCQRRVDADRSPRCEPHQSVIQPMVVDVVSHDGMHQKFWMAAAFFQKFCSHAFIFGKCSSLNHQISAD